MTIDERIEFLMQSIKYHDRQLGELRHKIGRVGDKVDRLASKVDKLADKVDKVTDSAANPVSVPNDDAAAIRMFEFFDLANDCILDRPTALVEYLRALEANKNSALEIHLQPATA
jgi:uncharacterized coiled-coil protein SlyX